MDPTKLIATIHQRGPTEDPLVLLDTAVAVAAEVGESAEAAVDHYVAAARATGLSWTAIGERLGVSKTGGPAEVLLAPGDQRWTGR